MSIPTHITGGVINIQDASLTPEGYEQITALTPVAGLTVPGDARMALIQVLTESVRWRDDGTDPTTTVGMLVTAGNEFWYTGDLSTIKFLEVTANAEVNVAYYSTP